jgi:regulation of enolase protein 1 (concanavalin A-like superfamily)
VCKRFRNNEDRLQLHALAYNLATFLRCIELPEAMADWSLTSLQLNLIKIGARVVRHARAITFQLAEVAVKGPMIRAILAPAPPASQFAIVQLSGTAAQSSVNMRHSRGSLSTTR